MSEKPEANLKYPTAAPLSTDAFVARLESVHRLLWLVAAGVLGNRVDADDVVQEATMIGLQKRAEFDPDSNFKAWMVQIVRNVALNHGRKVQRRQANEQASPVVDDALDSTSTASPVDERGGVMANQEAFDDRVLGALRTLGETARACLLLKTVEGLAYAEIATALGIPEGTAMSHVHRSRREMRKHLSDVAVGGGR